MKVTVLNTTLDVPELAVVRMVAEAHGFDDVDVEPYPEKTTIRAAGPGGKSLTINAPTLLKACAIFFDRLGLT